MTLVFSKQSFDCDPCMQVRDEGCGACTAAGCFWCNLDLEPLCISAGSSDWPLDSVCLASDFVGVAKDCPLDGTPATSSPVPEPIDIDFTCNTGEDTCFYQFDAICDAGTGFCDSGSDW